MSINAIPEYLIGNVITIKMVFGNQGVALRPASVTIEFKNSEGAIVSGNMTPSNAGEYKYEFNTTGQTLGIWTYYIKATNPDSAGEGAFSIRDKHLLT